MEIKFEPLSTYGDLMTIKEFKKNVNYGGFIDYDGYGKLSNGKLVANNFIVYPSQFKRGKVHYGLLFETGELIDIPKWATHVMWFNR